ncbi:hypothetical protein FPSE_08271 [Fusarium pseudograminearum CS3096]|uniref:Uncharacterized protein n=1 Tax=Fusarium pseudograminearum (strain CS3096) TaxID=1028729 RepID=K3VYZ9_FUSPC|nr:hypothetical protein FPSE_08271 [Fusarium pseudograminearum CS3096]EKJ71530.1 hypothetical protein FPSE_08271 [Fusarium pseudograminearum CS3096]
MFPRTMIPIFPHTKRNNMNFKTWKRIPASRREIFDLEDIDRKSSHILNAAVRSGVTSFSLQVCPVRGDQTCRYHFYLELDTSIPFRDVEGNMASIRGLVMWMECYGHGWGELTFGFVIRDRPFPGPLLADFKFPLMGTQTSGCITLLHLIDLLRGVPREELRDEDCFDLTKFRFCPISQDLRGYRDALTQWMVRLCNNGFVGWWSYHQSVVNTVYVDDYEGDEYPDEHANNAFGRIIGLNYHHNAEFTAERRLIVHMTTRLIRRGVWLDREFHRAEHFGEIDLPYEYRDDDEAE